MALEASTNTSYRLRDEEFDSFTRRLRAAGRMIEAPLVADGSEVPLAKTRKFKLSLQRGRVYTRRRAVAATAAVTLLAGLTAVGIEGQKAIMQHQGKRCKLEQLGYQVKAGASLRGIVADRHPNYNPFQTDGAVTCMIKAEGNKGKISSSGYLGDRGTINVYGVK